MGTLLFHGAVLTDRIWRIRLQIFVKPYEMALAGGGSCDAGVTFRAATGSGFSGRRFGVSDGAFAAPPGCAGASPPLSGHQNLQG